MDLVLNSYGLSLSKHNNGFLITSSEDCRHVSTDQIDSILITQGAQITSDAVILALENEIGIIFISKGGRPLGQIWSAKYGSISTIRKGQLSFVSSPAATKWIKEILSIKIMNQINLMKKLADGNQLHIDKVSSAIKKMGYIRSRLLDLKGDKVKDLASSARGLEGAASKCYFRVFSQLLPTHYRFTARSHHPAKDPANALLNYGYGIMYGKIESALICAGIDPYVGILHRDEYNKPVLTYDIIELFRTWVDLVVFRILEDKQTDNRFFFAMNDGSVWLEEPGRRIVIQSLNDYLQEIEEGEGEPRTRLTRISLYAQSLAQKFKKMN